MTTYNSDSDISSNLTKTTAYSITNEDGSKSTITMPKVFSDGLVSRHGDRVHSWVQEAYYRAVRKNKEHNNKLWRREIGDLVRAEASIESIKETGLLF